MSAVSPKNARAADDDEDGTCCSTGPRMELLGLSSGVSPSAAQDEN